MDTRNFFESKGVGDGAIATLFEGFTSKKSKPIHLAALIHARLKGGELEFLPSFWYSQQSENKDLTGWLSPEEIVFVQYFNLLTTYKAFVRHLLEYCSPLSAGDPASRLSRLHAVKTK